MRFIITGHMGLIGKPLKKKLLDLGNVCVDCVDKRDNLETNTDEMSDWKTKADIVFHLADNCKINQIIKNPELAFENSRGIESVLEMCRKNKIKKIVYFSSSRVLSEEKNPYTASKKYGEELVKSYSKCYGIKYIIIRPSTVYGGHDETNRLINIWLNNALHGKDLIIYGADDKTLSFTYINDFINAIKTILKKDKWNTEYNIAGSTEYLYDVAKYIIQWTQSTSKIVFKINELEQPQNVKLKSDIKCPIGIKDGIKYEISRILND